jgi:tripartite-type tricarboxylate transporter receptor subunit TctC
VAESTGQTFPIDNRGGAGGTIGADLVAKSLPDGYTIMVQSVTHVGNAHLYKKLPYDTLKDFAPVGLLTGQMAVLTVHPSLPVKSVKEFIALAKARPNEILYSTAGNGSIPHLSMALLESMANVKLVHVPYKGGGPAMIDVVAGQVPITFATAASVSPHTKSGRLRGLGITGSQRSTLLPDLPTIAEAGLPGYEMINWLGLFAPTGTPRAIVDRLARESLRIVQTPEVRERLNSQGAEPSPLNTDAFTAFVKNEVAKWAKVVTATGMTTD